MNKLLLLLMIFSYGCVITKVVTVPLRVCGGIISIVPLVGDKMHDAIDTVADEIDDIPI